ncbi:MAG: hypothetical protein V3U82_00965 [Robiginitomaculum sp.]
MIQLLKITLTSAALLVLPSGAHATDAQDVRGSAPLTVLGLSLGMDAGAIAPLMEAAKMAPHKSVRRTQVSNTLTPSQYMQIGQDPASASHLKIDYAGPKAAARIIAIDYAFGEDIDAGARLKANLTQRYGKALARYRLSDRSEMLVWERVAPKQSRDFGPLMTIALTTGENGRLNLSQFVRNPSLKIARLKSHAPAQSLLGQNSGTYGVPYYGNGPTD